MATKVSDWQTGVPPSDGIWQINTKEKNYPDDYYVRFKTGAGFDAGYTSITNVPTWGGAYPSNNNPRSPVKWRGLLND